MNMEQPEPQPHMDWATDETTENVNSCGHTLGEFLDSLASFEARMTEWYAAIRDHTPDNKVALLTYFLCRHGSRLAKLQNETPPAALEHIRLVKCPQTGYDSLTASFSKLQVNPSAIEGLQLLQTALDYQTALTNILKTLQRTVRDRTASTFFSNLSVHEDRDIVRLRKMISSSYF